MFILFGTRSSKLNNTYTLPGTSCAHCGNQDTIQVHVYGRYFHIFFIPIFPLWKTTVAECTHCRKSYAENQFTPPMRINLAQQQIIRPAKRPIWHSLGLLMLIPAFLLIIISVMIALVSSGNKSNSDGPDYAEMLRSDLRKTVNNPDEETDSISYHIKTYMDLMLTTELNKDDIEYYTRVENGKMLVLVKVDQMKKVEKRSRKDFMKIVKLALSDLNIPEAEQAYIGIHGRWNMVLTNSPTDQDMSGDFAENDILYPFYYNDEVPANKGDDTNNAQLEDKLIEEGSSQ